MIRNVLVMSWLTTLAIYWWTLEIYLEYRALCGFNNDCW
jgi:hypothetical protein